MSLDNLTSKVARIREQASRVQNGFQGEVDEIKRDTDLSEDGKRKQIKAAYDDAKEQLSALRAQEGELVDAKIESLQRSLFGLSAKSDSQILLYRDAQDRAARLTEETAQEAFEQALMSDDKTLQTAIVARAVKELWAGGILEAYTKKHPVAGEYLADLEHLERYAARENAMHRGMHYLLMPPV